MIVPNIVGLDIFELNPNFEISYEQVKNQKITIIDNFYKTPDHIRNFASQLPVYSMDWDNDDVESYRGRWLSPHNSDELEKFNNVLSSLVGNKAKVNSMMFSFYKFQKNKKTNNDGGNHNWKSPHIDRNHNGIIYLNTEEECSGGTSFFEHRESKDFFINDGDIPKYVKYINDVNPDDSMKNNYKYNWNILKTIKMKYNRLILFNARMFHSINFEPNSFINNFRITQNFYL